MSLKYRLIILTVAVFAVTFGVGTLLGVQAAGRLAERQVLSRLRRSAGALAASAAPLNEEVLTRLAPLLEADVMVVDSGGRVVARSAGDWPWRELWGALTQAAVFVSASETLSAGGREYYFSESSRQLPATGQEVRVLLFADAGAVRQSTGAIVTGYLSALAVTSVLLAAGTYVVGLLLVRRVRRLNRRVDATFPEEGAGRRRRGDELTQLSGAFEDLLGRLDRSRQRLTSQQRLVTTGKIASSVAHEVRNPLQAMRLTLQMIGEKCPPDLREGCELLLSEVDRLGLLTDELLVLAGKDTRRVERVDLGSQLRETLRLMEFQLRRRDIRTDVALPELPPVRMDPSRCRQLFLNLLLNAAEASPRGGTVRVQAEPRGPSVVVTIADSGPGFPQPVLAGQAEEFFSTKTAGAGLGLAICRRIVAEAGGELKLYNTDAGAVAETHLPAGAEPSREIPDPAA